MTTSGGSGGVTFTSTNMPTGVSITSSTGAISGKPTVAYRYLTTVTATDSVGATDTETFVWTVTGGIAITIGSPVNQSTSSGTAVSGPTATASGGSDPYYGWTATGLPTGLSINASTGKITGTPTTPGSYTVTITAQNYYLFLGIFRVNDSSAVFQFTWTVT